jgi:hypothetical protein
MDELTGMTFDPDAFKQGAGDEKLFVVFHMDILQDDAASTNEGRPIYRDTEFVRIFIPGDKSNVIDRPVRPSDRTRFPKQYSAFKAGGGEEAQLVGTPLKDWPMMGRAQCAELHYFGIRTVEQLADVRDDITLKMPGLTSLKQTAGVWLQKAKSTAEAAKISKQLDQMKQTNDEQSRNLAELMAANKALQQQLQAVLAERAGLSLQPG